MLGNSQPATSSKHIHDIKEQDSSCRLAES